MNDGRAPAGTAGYLRPVAGVRRACGFSLVELLVALALVSAFVVVALPAFSGGGDTLKARSAAREVHRVLKAARDQAITWAKPSEVIIDTQGQRVALTGSAVEYRIPAGMHLTRAAQTADTWRVVFFPDGTVSGGAFALVGKRKTFRFELEPLTGQVAIDAQVSDSLASR